MAKRPVHGNELSQLSSRREVKRQGQDARPGALRRDPWALLGIEEEVVAAVVERSVDSVGQPPVVCRLFTRSRPDGASAITMLYSRTCIPGS